MSDFKMALPKVREPLPRGWRDLSPEEKEKYFPPGIPFVLDGDAAS
jgi:hypothetical protein